jgi:O-antigen ligase
MLCNYLNVGIVFALFALTEKWGPHKLAVILCLIIAITAAFTFSIGLGGLALAIGVWILLSMHVEKRLKMTAFALGCLVAIFFLVVSLFALAPYPGAQVVLSVPCLNIDLMPSARMLVWADAMRTFLSHPITGLGLGEPVANVVFTNTDGSLSLLTDAHNSFLSVAAQNGVIGLTAFMAIVFVIMKRWSRDIVSNTSITILGALGLAFTCSFVYQGLTGSFEDARHLWVLLGIFLAGDRVGQTES